MFRTDRKTTLTVCISLLVMMLASTAFAETIGQKTVRLKRERDQGKTSEYSRDKPAADKSPAMKVAPNVKVTPLVPEKTVEEETPKDVKKTALEPVKPVSGDFDPLSLVPGDALVCVRINKFGDSLSSLDQFLLGVSPLPVPLSMMATGQIGTILGNPMLSGINFSGDVILFANADPAKRKSSFAVLVPITSYEEFTKGNPNCSVPDADGISIIAPPKAMFGKFVTAKAPGGKYAYLAQKNAKSALLKAINSTTKANSLATKVTANEQKRTTTAPVWVYGNIEHAATAFKPLIAMGLSSIPKKAGSDPAATIINSIDQIKSLSITLTPTEKKLALTLSISAKPGSAIAKAMAADPAMKGGFELSGFLKDKAAMNLVTKINKPLINKVIDQLLALVPKGPNGRSMLPPAMKSMLTEYLDVAGTEMAYSLSPAAGKVPYTYKQIIKLADAEKASSLHDKNFKMLGATTGPDGKKMIEMATYSNVNMYTMNIPTPSRGGDSTLGLKSMNMAVSGDFMLSCTGDIDVMKSLIHKSKGATPRASGDMAKAFEIVDNSGDMDIVASINLLRLMNVASKALKSAPVPQAQMAASMISGMPVDSRSCMAVAGKIDDGRVDACVVLPKDHLMEVMGAFMQMQMQKMQKMQEQKNSEK